MARRWREATLILVCLVMLAGLWAREPIHQDTIYHRFADQRELLGVPHLFDVASNIAFLIIGVAGILLCAGRRRPPLAASWSTLFVGTALVFLGSSYYHWQPSNETLLWDRLPMTVGFMALFVALLAEHMGERLERLLLAPAVALGVASALWWHFTDDLRFYFWVQFTPLVCIPLVLAMYRGRYTHRAYLLYALGFYVCAKLTEVWDHQIFALTSNVISGHTLKHLLAAAAVFAILLMLDRREPAAAR
ncbi:MAG TPA: ceramidase domain-containing protein [Burkholderiales bacterium]|nr:ceramidase domain-containing protein [Burkholderiales bacterium]